MDWESPNFIQCQIILLCSSQPKKFCQPNTHCVSHTTQPTLDYYRFTALPIGSKLCISKYFHHLDLPWWLWPILSEAAVWPPRARVVGEPPILGQAAVRPLAPRQAAVAASVPGVQHHGHGPELLKKSSTRHCMLRNAEGCGTWEEERLRCCFQSIRQSWNIVMICWLHWHNSCISEGQNYQLVGIISLLLGPLNSSKLFEKSWVNDPKAAQTFKRSTVVNWTKMLQCNFATWQETN